MFKQTHSTKTAESNSKKSILSCKSTSPKGTTTVTSVSKSPIKTPVKQNYKFKDINKVYRTKTPGKTPNPPTETETMQSLLGENNLPDNNNVRNNSIIFNNSRSEKVKLSKSQSKKFKNNSLAFRKTASIEMLRRHFYDPNIMGYDEETLYKLTQNQVQEFFPEHFSVSVIKTEKNSNQTRKIKTQNSRFEWRKFFSSIFCGACFNVKTFITVTLWISFFVFLFDPCVLGPSTQNNHNFTTRSYFFNRTPKHNNIVIHINNNIEDTDKLISRLDNSSVIPSNHSLSFINKDGNDEKNNNNGNDTEKLKRKRIKGAKHKYRNNFSANTTVGQAGFEGFSKEESRCLMVRIYLFVIGGGIILYFILTLIYTYQLYVIWTSVPWYLIECITFAFHAILLCAMSITACFILEDWRRFFAMILLVDSLLSLVIVFANLCFYFTGSTPLLQYYANLKTGYNPIDKIFAKEKMESFVNWVKQQNYKTKRTNFIGDNKSPE